MFDTRDANDDLTLRLVTVTTSAELLSLSANTLEMFTLSFSIRLHSAGQEEPDTLFMACLSLSLSVSVFGVYERCSRLGMFSKWDMQLVPFAKRTSSVFLD